MAIGFPMRGLVVAVSLVGALCVPSVIKGNVPYLESASAFNYSMKLQTVGTFLRKLNDGELAEKPGCAWFDDYTLCWGYGAPEVLVDLRNETDSRRHSDLGDVVVVDGNTVLPTITPGTPI